MLDQLHRRHSEIYRLEHSLSISDFLVTDNEDLEGVEQPQRMRNLAEKVLISECDDTLNLAVFLERSVLDRLAAANPLDDLSDAVLGDFWLALEGISHFNCLVFNAHRETSVSLLELELQAEIDKYVATLLLADEQGYKGIDWLLHERLFEDTRLADDLNPAERERYSFESRYAANYCRTLHTRHRADHARFLGELRDFYRLGRPDKLSHIHAM